jgi:hypothetical protein
MDTIRIDDALDQQAHPVSAFMTIEEQHYPIIGMESFSHEW